MQFRLFENPDRAVHQADAFVGLAEPQSIRFTTQQRPGSNVVFVVKATCCCWAFSL